MTDSRSPVGAGARGATMVEVLVALLILAVGLMGAAALQSRALQVELDAYQRSQALILAQDMVSRINTNRPAAGCYNTMSADPNYVGTGNENPAGCLGWGTSATRERADNDLDQWVDLLTGGTETLNGSDVGGMTGARGCIEHVAADNVFIVTVAWQGQEQTVAPTDNTCAQGEYGNDAQRRVVSLSLRLAELE